MGEGEIRSKGFLDLSNDSWYSGVHNHGLSFF